VWEVEGTDGFVTWFEALGRDDKVRVEATIEHLERLGPGLGRPWADSLRGTKVKELIPRGGHLRILFRFDPRSVAILLVGGDKADRWAAWYEELIPVAENEFRLHLDELRAEGLIR
jgi:hypothetical protein